jgi:hypothetical protein
MTGGIAARCCRRSSTRAEFGEVPREPVILWGWGWLPDQYGRETDDDPA